MTQKARATSPRVNLQGAWYHSIGIIGRQVAGYLLQVLEPHGDLLQVLERHGDVEPVKDRRTDDAGIGEDASWPRAPIGEGCQRRVLGSFGGVEAPADQHLAVSIGLGNGTENLAATSFRCGFRIGGQCETTDGFLDLLASSVHEGPGGQSPPGGSRACPGEGRDRALAFFHPTLGIASMNPVTDRSLPSCASIAKSVPPKNSGDCSVPPALQLNRTRS